MRTGSSWCRRRSEDGVRSYEALAAGLRSNSSWRVLFRSALPFVCFCLTPFSALLFLHFHYPFVVSPVQPFDVVMHLR